MRFSRAYALFRANKTISLLQNGSTIHRIHTYPQRVFFCDFWLTPLQKRQKYILKHFDNTAS